MNAAVAHIIDAPPGVSGGAQEQLEQLLARNDLTCAWKLLTASVPPEKGKVVVACIVRERTIWCRAGSSFRHAIELVSEDILECLNQQTFWMDVFDRKLAGPCKQLVGWMAESRVLRIMQRPPFTRLRWLYGVRLGTSEEDQEGNDVFCNTKKGPFYVQVKSSMASALAFEAKHPHLPRTVIIVCSRQRTDEKVSRILLHQLTKKYRQLGAP